VDNVEVFCGCNMENLYHVYASKGEGEKSGKKLFVANEKSGCCNR